MVFVGPSRGISESTDSASHHKLYLYLFVIFHSELRLRLKGVVCKGHILNTICCLWGIRQNSSRVIVMLFNYLFPRWPSTDHEVRDGNCGTESQECCRELTWQEDNRIPGQRAKSVAGNWRGTRTTEFRDREPRVLQGTDVARGQQNSFVYLFLNLFYLSNTHP
jgi:hypothetical protein